MSNIVRHFLFPFIKESLMKTIKATKTVSITTIDEVIDAINTYGSENVTVLDFSHTIMPAAMKNGINPSQWVQLLNNCNTETCTKLIEDLFYVHEFFHSLCHAAHISMEAATHEVLNVAIERKIKLERLPNNTSIEQLNIIVENKLIHLYYVENVRSIDAEFVKKHHESMDLAALKRVTNDDEVKDLISSLEF